MKRSPRSSGTPWYYVAVALLAACILVAASGSISLLYLRRQIEMTAQQINGQQQELVKLRRAIAALDDQISNATQPGVLLAQMHRLQLNLGPARGNQIVYLGPVDQARDPQSTAPVAAADRPAGDLLDYRNLQPLRRLN